MNLMILEEEGIMSFQDVGKDSPQKHIMSQEM